MTEDTLQREYPVREVFNGLRYILRAGMQLRLRPTTCRRDTGCINKHSERLAERLAGLHFVALAMLMAHRFIASIVPSA